MTNSSGKNHAAAAIAWLAYLLLTLWLALALAWKTSALLGYGYPFWYEQMAIQEHISQYAPKHPYKRGFSQLPPEQHQQAFAQIVDAVHNDGEGLATLTYPGPGGAPVTLLDADETGHLEDVATLMSRLDRLTLLVLPLWVLCALAVSRLGKPSRKARLVSVAVLVVVVALPLLFIGPKQVFYILHEWVFPPDHPWFFYWNESLMSTLMKAPFLFGGIAAMIGLLALPFAWLVYRAGLAAPSILRARGASARI